MTLTRLGASPEPRGGLSVAHRSDVLLVLALVTLGLFLGLVAGTATARAGMRCETHSDDGMTYQQVCVSDITP